MDSNRFEEFKSKIERRMANLDAKLSYMREGLDGFQKEFNDFRSDMGDFRPTQPKRLLIMGSDWIRLINLECRSFQNGLNL